MDKQKVLIVALAIVMIVGLGLVISGPHRVSDKYLAGVEAREVQQLLTIEKFQAKLEQEAGWYKPEYVAPILDLVKSGRDNLSQAAADIKEAKAAGSSKKKAQAVKAAMLIESADQVIGKADEKLATLKKSTAEARGQLSRLLAKIGEVNKNYGLAEDKLSKEGSNLLSKYVTRNTEELSAVKANLAGASANLEKTSGFLPVESSKQQGDPQQALKLLAATDQIIDTANVAVCKVIDNLNFCKEATEKAAPETAAAKETILAADNHLSDLVDKGPFLADKALKQAYADLSDAQQLSAVATAALQTVVEAGKYDFPLAFDSALKANKLASGAIAKADQQVKMLQEFNDSVAALRTNLASFEDNIISQALQYQELLRFHNKSVWSNVAGNMKSANDQYMQAKNLLAEARKVAAEDQAYESALANLAKCRQTLAKGKDLLQELIKVVKDLESYRADWPSQEKRAKRMINDNQGQITSYGSYSSSAKSDFDSAVRHLANARREAKNELFESACWQAKQAYQLAEGTGHRAKKAYDDYEDSQSTSISFDSGSSSSGGSIFDTGSSGGYFESGSSGGLGSDGAGMSGSSGSDGGGQSDSSGTDGNGW